MHIIYTSIYLTFFYEYIFHMLLFISQEKSANLQ